MARCHTYYATPHSTQPVEPARACAYAVLGNRTCRRRRADRFVQMRKHLAAPCSLGSSCLRAYREPTRCLPAEIFTVWNLRQTRLSHEIVFGPQLYRFDGAIIVFCPAQYTYQRLLKAPSADIRTRQWVGLFIVSPSDMVWICIYDRQLIWLHSYYRTDIKRNHIQSHGHSDAVH